MPELKLSLKKFTAFFPIAYTTLAFLRLSEALLINHRHYLEGVNRYQVYGFLLDIPIVTMLLIILFPLFYLIYLRNRKWATWFMVSIFIFTIINHLFILQYFSYFLIPLSRLLKANTINEIFFTLSTSEVDTGMAALWLVLIGGAISVLLISLKIFKHAFINRIITITGICVSVFLFFLSNIFYKTHHDRIANNMLINKSLFFFSEVFFPQKTQYQNSITIKDINDFQKDYPLKSFMSDEYPLMNMGSDQDVIGSYFNFLEPAPNIVLIIVEGLGTRLLEPFQGVHLMPFLDDIKNQSLYWPNCLASSERSFGAVPTLTGSLPHGTKGFNFLEPLPAHFSLYNTLKNNNYRTVFFYGQGAWFHRKDLFLRENRVDLIIDNSNYSENYKKIVVGSNNYFWGYNDKDLFDQSFEIMDTLPSNPMFNTYFTGTTHSPFYLPDIETYNFKLDSVVNLHNAGANKKYFETYRKYLRTFLFTDDALKEFFTKYKERPDYQNTIFIITGDHPITEIPIQNWLKRYQVPMLIYSDLLIQPKTFPPVVSHFDLMPTLTGLLKMNFGLKFPYADHSLGVSLDTASNFRNIHPIVMMNADREIEDYFFNNYFLSEGKTLFKVDSLFELSFDKNPNTTEDYKNRLQRFKVITDYACLNNRLIPDSLYLSFRGFQFLESSFSSDIKIQSDIEFFNLITPFFHTSQNDVFVTGELSDYSTSDYETAPSLILQITDSDGKSILWEPIKLENTQNDYKIRNQFAVSDKGNPPYRFAFYFWNPQKGDLNYSSAKFFIYQLNRVF